MALTDISGDVTDRYQYEPYGTLTHRIGNTSTPFLYNGKYGVMTDTNGLYHMRARYYNPEIRRFINQDLLLGSIVNGQSLNRYAYVNGNPVSYVDPFGLSRDGDTQLLPNPDDNWQDYLFKLNTNNVKDIANDIKTFAAPDPNSNFDMAMLNLEQSNPHPAIKFAGAAGIVGRKTITKAADFAGDVIKKIPNPFGRKGGPLHQGKIDELVNELESQGYTVVKEYRIQTPGGYKDARYGDIMVTSPKGEQFIIQVGKQTQAGELISREMKALRDMQNAGWQVEFAPYN